MTAPASPPRDGAGVGVRTLLLGEMPLLATALGTGDAAGMLHDLLRERGVAPLPAFVGQELPRGARVGIQLDDAQLRLLDDRDTLLLRAPRHGVDDGWRRAALRLKGTMLLVAEELDLGPHLDARQVVAALDAHARDGRLLGAIVGVAEARPTLPLLLV